MLINKDSFQTQSRSVAKIHFATCKSQIGNFNIGDRTESCQSCHRSVSVDAGLPGRLRLEQQSVIESTSLSVGVSRRERRQFGPTYYCSPAPVRSAGGGVKLWLALCAEDCEDWLEPLHTNWANISWQSDCQLESLTLQLIIKPQRVKSSLDNSSRTIKKTSHKRYHKYF